MVAADIAFGGNRSYSDSGTCGDIDYHGSGGGRIAGAIGIFSCGCCVGGSGKMVF